MTHTAGPYVALPSDNVEGAFVIMPARSLGELPIAIVPINRRTKDVVAANAQMFATAPLMLDALREWKCPGCGGSGTYHHNAAGRARAIERGRPIDPKFQPDPVTCKVCDGNKLHPIATAAIKAATRKF